MVGSKNILLENLDSNSKSKLSARFSADSFVYGIFNESNNLIHAVSHEKDLDLEAIYQEISALNIQKLIFNFTTSPFFHTPFKDDSLIEQMPSFHGKTVLKSQFNDIYTLFGIDRPYLDFVERFPNSKIVHVSNLLINTKLDGYSDCIVAFFDRNTLHLSYSIDGSLKFYNQYRCKTKNDYLYWIEAVYEILDLKKKEVPLAIAGDIVSNLEVFNFLSNYIPQARLARPEVCNDGTRASDNKEQTLFDLYQSLLCE